MMSSKEPKEPITLSGSERQTPKGKRLSTLNPNEVIEVTVRVRRRTSLEPFLNKYKRDGRTTIISREEYNKEYGADPQDILKVEEFAHDHSLTIVESDTARRSVVLRGTIQAMSQAFDVHLAHYEHENGEVFRGRTGPLKIPGSLANIVEAVFGLDDRPQASPKFRIQQNGNQRFAPHAVGKTFSPVELAKLYNFPTDVDGQGQTIAIIELGGGYRTKDLNAYFSQLFPGSSKKPKIKSLSVDGGHNNATTPDSADGEVMLDIEVAGGVAPGSNIVVYFAPNTDRGFLDAITTAIHDTHNKPSVISISWGAAESAWTEQAMTSFNQAFQTAAALGVTVCCASGDNGSNDNVDDGQVHVDFPASSPFVLACGGTTLKTQANKIQSEEVWQDLQGGATGGGISQFFSEVPDYQKNAKIPPSAGPNPYQGRGVPDIAANADPATGYNVLVDGQPLVIGGTSAVSPLFSGLVALLNQKLNAPVGFLNPTLYTAPSCPLNDITKGNNITTSAGLGYKAGPGWDPCTGLGSPEGNKLLDLLQEQQKLVTSER